MSQSEAEALVNLVSVSLVHAFKKKFQAKTVSESDLVMDSYRAIHYDILHLEDEIMSFGNNNATWKDAVIADDLPDASKAETEHLLNEFSNCFGYFEQEKSNFFYLLHQKSNIGFNIMETYTNPKRTESALHNCS